MPFHTLVAGFSGFSGAEKPCNKKQHKPKEELNVKSPTKNNKPKLKVVRRGGDCKFKYVKGESAVRLKIFSANCASLKNGKINSLNAEVRSTKANIVTLQEVHYRQKGKIKMDKSFVVFEAIRTKKGGGTAIAVHESLKPKLIEEYSDEFELLVVEVETKENNIRIISGYGPQENIEEEKRVPFFLAIETEVEKATLAGKSIIIETDANSKLGSKYIPNDPHEQSPNGALLAAIIERQNLILGNGSPKCRGTITRLRTTTNRTEKSAIDMIMFSNDLTKHLVSVHIDEERKHVLSKIHKTKRGVKVKESDHNSIITEFDCQIIKDTDEKKLELYDLKDKDSQVKFKAYTTETNMLSSIFNKDSDDIDTLTCRLIKKINGSIAINFKKKRVSTNKECESDRLYNRMRYLKGKEDDQSKTELEAVTKAIADNAENNFYKLKQQLDKIKPDSGGVNAHEMWKLRKKMCPKNRDPPTAMTDKKGNLLTSDKAIQNRALEAYAERLENNTIEPHLKDLENDINEL